ncbi:hypothetical protein B296_00030680 [Ensete ventricosum]|uniref:Protein TIFY n=1 Tax=Ensete ventricosum TaxID=4639 RepID=A0A426YEW4_ENSVE|nr:hypothetical protein B296_00030680 [Ensete ventricosum]
MVGSRRDPDLRLRLGINGGGGDGGRCSTEFSPSRVEEVSGSSRSEYHHHHQQQQLTICYNGGICVCDVTEIEVEAIIAMARQETDDQTRKKRQEQQSKESSTTSSSPLPPHHLHVDPELSRKRSLQRFLQKRNSRTNAVSPYRHPPQLFFSIKS